MLPIRSRSARWNGVRRSPARTWSPPKPDRTTVPVPSPSTTPSSPLNCPHIAIARIGWPTARSGRTENGGLASTSTACHGRSYLATRVDPAALISGRRAREDVRDRLCVREPLVGQGADDRGRIQAAREFCPGATAHSCPDRPDEQRAEVLVVLIRAPIAERLDIGQVPAAPNLERRPVPQQCLTQTDAADVPVHRLAWG